ncbi:ABC transporter substrate-binding protein [Nocardiopsis sp. CT-R113]|uniref:ABC transporter substrate-binding protein n=1 Tax=Nocardiopsis codii TaxID=3065942 RepID=A0ABU7KCT2_9ACTN|nr:ABC transporter substrate-binding protein [Nocardiopsis sp. CT-R113]MEE2040007.1 ABC transporter substrate-binding protein [Nocardiopsis sp. CT-R113]
MLPPLRAPLRALARAFVTATRGAPRAASPGRAPATHTAHASARALRRYTALALVPLLAATACGAQSRAAPSEPLDGGTLTFALAADPACVDPHQVGNNQGLNVGRQVVDSLTDQDPETGEIVPWLAESWETDEDASSYTFRLREGASFSDGVPLDAEAVRANFEAVVELGALSGLGSSYLGEYEETEIVDEYTATVHFSAPNTQFLQATSTMSLGLVSPASLASTTPEERCQGEFAGSGPFTVEDYTPDQHVILTGRDDYDQASSRSSHTGPTRLDGVEFRIMPEAGVRTGALLSGQVDAIADIPPQDEARFADTDFTILTRPNPGVPFNLHPNLASPALADAPEVIEAVQIGIDRQEVVDTVLSDRYPVATGPLAAVTDHASDLGDRLAHDPAAAAAILEDAGWVEGGDGIRERDGERLEVDVVFAALFNGNENALELIQQQLRAIGIDLELRLLTPAEQTAVVDAGAYDFDWYNTTRTDPDILRTLFSTRYTNRTNLAEDDTLDALLDDQAAASDPEARAALVHDAQAHIIENGYIIPVFEFAQVHGVAPHVHGIAFEASSRLSLYEAWVEAD